MATTINNITVEVTSGTPVEVDIGTSGITVELISGLKGDKGDQGDQGIQGIQGIQGPAGNDGIDGVDGSPALLDRSSHTLSQGQSTVTHTSALINTAVYMNGFRLDDTDFTINSPLANDVTLVVPVQSSDGASIIVETSS